MHDNSIDRMRVARVRVTSPGAERDITDCWISVDTEKKQVGIWLDNEGAGPALSVPLADTRIEWHRSDTRGPQNADIPVRAPVR